ncbi:MAG: ribosome biogenesis GTPase Der [Patescibacteria group bacterium]|nr:ribosome biogenesis GTPase Der [Patescibacteria group bacterium]
METLNLKTVALIGRPNVGKSTLFNRFIGKREAIETPIAGTTRDRLYGEVFWRGEKFNLIDVAGIEVGTKTEIDKSIQEGVDLAIESSDLIVFIVDWNEKDNEADKQVARRLRKIDKKVIVAVNKADNLEKIQSIDEFKRFGNFEVIPVSAISGKNTGDLLDAIIKDLGESSQNIAEEANNKDIIKLAIIGRPNVGKSTLLNSIMGEKRAVVSSLAGTTRDVLDVVFSHKDGKIRIFDTAGLRRRGKIVKDSIESFSVLRTNRALQNCDIAVLMVNAEEGLVAGDVHILGQAKEYGKGIILCVNKIDLVERDRQEFMSEMLNYFQLELNFVPWLPVVFISAQNSENVNALLSQVIKVSKNRKTKIEQEDLNQILEFAKESNFQLQNVKSLSQKKANPPIFELKYIREKPHYTQIRYLENKIRDVFPMEGSPIFIDILSVGRNQKRKRSRK